MNIKKLMMNMDVYCMRKCYVNKTFLYFILYNRGIHHELIKMQNFGIWLIFFYFLRIDHLLKAISLNHFIIQQHIKSQKQNNKFSKSRIFI